MDTTITADELRAMTVVQIKSHSLYKNCGLVGKSKLRKADLIRELIAWRTRAQTRRNDQRQQIQRAAAGRRASASPNTQRGSISRQYSTLRRPIRRDKTPRRSARATPERSGSIEQPQRGRGPCPNDQVSREHTPFSGRLDSRERSRDAVQRLGTSQGRVHASPRSRAPPRHSSSSPVSQSRGVSQGRSQMSSPRRETRSGKKPAPPAQAHPPRMYQLSRKFVDRIILELTNIGTAYHLLKDIERANAYDTAVNNIKTNATQQMNQSITLNDIKQLPGIGSSISLDIDQLYDQGFTNRMEYLKDGSLDEIIYRVKLLLDSKYL